MLIIYSTLRLAVGFSNIVLVKYWPQDHETMCWFLRRGPILSYKFPSGGTDALSLLPTLEMFWMNVSHFCDTLLSGRRPLLNRHPRKWRYS